MKKICLSMLTSLLLLSCSSEKIPETVSPSQIKIDGNLGEQFSVVEKEYSFPKHSSNFMIELKRAEEPLPNFDRIGVGIEFFDETGKSINVQKPRIESLSGLAGSFPLTLLQLETGGYGYLSIYLEGWPEKLYKAKTFKITIQTNADEVDQSTTSNKSTSNNSTSSKWDKILDSYEKYIDQYIKLYKKAQAGDMSAMSEYTSILEKANELASQLEKANNNLSPKQVARFSKLQAKLTSAIL